MYLSNSMEEFQSKPERENPEQALERLQKIAEILKEMKLNVIDRAVTLERLLDATAEIGFPIVREGSNGVRASYSKRDGLRIWFTNGFDDPSNLTRQEITKKLKAAGLI